MAASSVETAASDSGSRGPKTAVALNGAWEEGSSSDPVRQTNERIDARKKSIDLQREEG